MIFEEKRTCFAQGDMPKLSLYFHGFLNRTSAFLLSL